MIKSTVDKKIYINIEKKNQIRIGYDALQVFNTISQVT